MKKITFLSKKVAFFFKSGLQTIPMSLYFMVVYEISFIWTRVCPVKHGPKSKEKRSMKASFYDVKARKMVEAEVKYKVQYPNGRYGIVGEIDGRKLPKFVKEEDYKKTYKAVPVLEAAKCAKKACAKKACKK